MTSTGPVKLTCHSNDGTKRNAYLTPKEFLYEFRQDIGAYLFVTGEQVHHDFKTYWIDQDSDEIDICNQSDYDIFLKSSTERPHIHAITKNRTETNKNNSTPSKLNFDGMFPTKAVHTTVECDACNKKPIIGFRYKCIECADFDLCQNCEAKHEHSEHMMVRMPHNDCPNVIEAWVSGRARRNHKRGGRGHCPFVPTPAPEPPTTSAPGGGDSERHHHGRRSQRRREMNPGLFGHLYKMMQDLAEGGVTEGNHAAANAACAANATAKAAEAAANVAAASAATATTSAAFIAANAATEGFATPNTTSTETKKEESTTGAVPKTPPSTPSTASTPQTSIPATPTLENLAQLVDPQYMRAGIQILNNFSEMFAKMLDPTDGVGMSFNNEQETTNESRKNSTASSTSTTSKATSTNTEQTKPVTTDAPTSTTDSPIVETVKPTLEEQTPKAAEQRSSQSLDDDWQMIEQQTSNSTEQNSVSATLDTPKSVNPTFDFAQLSENLKAHIEEEKKREVTAATAASTQTIFEVSSADRISEARIVSTPIATSMKPTPQQPQPETQAQAQTQQPVPQPRVNEERRAVIIYHPDQRINNAVHAMMAMGFSNEGAWLTQLLESVNGNIPEALDLMNAAQRNNN